MLDFMRKLSALVFLALCGCAHYQPVVSNSESPEKYRADLQYCHDHLRSDVSECSAAPLAGSFGLAGYAAYSAVTEKDDVCNMNGHELIDRCMTKKGYKIIK